MGTRWKGTMNKGYKGTGEDGERVAVAEKKVFE